MQSKKPKHTWKVHHLCLAMFYSLYIHELYQVIPDAEIQKYPKNKKQKKPTNPSHIYYRRLLAVLEQGAS